MAQTDHEPTPACHVVECAVHPDDIAVLSLRAYGKWIYAEANPEWIKNENVKAAYLELLQDYQTQEKEEEERGAHQSVQELGVEDAETPAAPLSTTDTKGWAQRDSGRDSGYASDKSDQDDTTLFVGEDDPGQRAKQRPIDEAAVQAQDGKDKLRDFLLQSLNSVLSEMASKHEAPKDRVTLAHWYNTDLLFYTLGASKNEDKLLRPILRDELDEAKYISKTLTPHITLPKYLRNLSHISWYSPNDIEVVEEEDNINFTIHPTIVRIPVAPSTNEDDKENTPTHRDCFLKLATSPDEHAIKRELSFLHDLKKRDLYSKGIKAPRLEGLVSIPSSPNSRTQILGFLLSLIPQPATPLIEYMDTSVSQSKRNTWAKEAELVVQILHDNDLIWGDAKADNFVVDKNGVLWMIDFGGSYTEGWIDEDLADTEEGDDQGTEKILRGLKDPENSVTTEEQDKERRKRKRSDDDEEGTEEGPEEGQKKKLKV